jgi:arsenate reductase-like glutaredoxin family protein
MAKENMLIKRPVVTLPNGILVGYSEDLYQQHFNTKGK